MARNSSHPCLAIGPANYAEQGYAWAHAVQDNLHVPASSFGRGPVRRHELTFQLDRVIPSPVFFTPIARKARMRQFLRPYSHVALDGFITFFQVPQLRDTGADALFLAEEGFEVALICHGGDVRDPAAHLARNKFSYFREADQQWLKPRYEKSARNRQVANTFGFPTFCSTPDLLLDVPGATWLPLTLDPARWATSEPVMERRVPRVFHLPSRRVPPIKGTQYIDPVLERLADRGLFEYVSPTRVPHAEMPALMASCDIVIDQLLTASYGVTAVEAMAAGRVTVSCIGPQTRGVMPVDPPIVEADPDTLEQVLLGLLEDRDGARATAEAGTAFVRRWHDGREAANRMAGYLGVPEQPIAG